jgi:hypothetical protein
MDSRPVPTEHLNAGADYLAAIRKLGLDPVYLGWGWERETSRWVLAMVTSIVDAGGPLALNELLFQAYNAEATPKEISPFIIRVLSPEMMPLSQFHLLSTPDLRIATVNGAPRPEIPPIGNVRMTVFGIDLEMRNSYSASGKPIAKYGAKREAWQRFKRQVEKLAA